MKDLERREGTGFDNMILESKNLSKTFYVKKREILALDHVSFSVKEQEILVIAGKSGAGKSVLLGILGGLDGPTSGTVLFEGLPLDRVSSSELALFRRKKIGFVFQNFNLIPSMTAFENVEVALLNTGMSRGTIRGRIEQLLTEFGLSARFDHLPSELSTGQQQRVAIARALANDPILILADEPTGDLDPTTGREIISYLTKIVRERRLTLVMASHSTSSLEIADGVIFIRDGRLTTREEAFI